jgi:segregation and condensation protein B
MNLNQLKHLIEAALLAYGQPLSMDQLRGLFDEVDRPEAATVREALEALARECADRPVELVEVASGWRLQVRGEYAAPLSRLWQERPGRYSRALLETIALIAYRQPITRGEIENVRGVQVNPNIVRTLTERGWIRVVGHREVPGHPELLGTTREFLDYFGLKSLDELPSLAALKDMDDVGIQLEFAGTVQAAAADLPAANDAEAAV